jgi:hypothetical protein
MIPFSSPNRPKNGMSPFLDRLLRLTCGDIQAKK